MDFKITISLSESLIQIFILFGFIGFKIVRSSSRTAIHYVSCTHLMQIYQCHTHIYHSPFPLIPHGNNEKCHFCMGTQKCELKGKSESSMRVLMLLGVILILFRFILQFSFAVITNNIWQHESIFRQKRQCSKYRLYFAKYIAVAFWKRKHLAELKGRSFYAN